MSPCAPLRRTHTLKEFDSSAAISCPLTGKTVRHGRSNSVENSVKRRVFHISTGCGKLRCGEWKPCGARAAEKFPQGFLWISTGGGGKDGWRGQRRGELPTMQASPAAFRPAWKRPTLQAPLCKGSTYATIHMPPLCKGRWRVATEGLYLAVQHKQLRY